MVLLTLRITCRTENVVETSLVPGPDPPEKEGPGIHCLRMCLISQKSWENRGLPCYIHATNQRIKTTLLAVLISKYNCITQMEMNIIGFQYGVDQLTTECLLHHLPEVCFFFLLTADLKHLMSKYACLLI